MDWKFVEEKDHGSASIAAQRCHDARFVQVHAEPMVHLINFEDKLMRGPSLFSDAEREIISAFTSGLNACTYGHRSHSYLVEELGVGESVVPALLDNYEKGQAQTPKSNRPNFAF